MTDDEAHTRHMLGEPLNQAVGSGLLWFGPAMIRELRDIAEPFTRFRQFADADDKPFDWDIVSHHKKGTAQ
jgi:hypothetical protein